jgi:hypothetical protein
MNLINIGHAPLFHIIFHMEILFLISIYIILYIKKRNTKLVNVLETQVEKISFVTCLMQLHVSHATKR